ncbi:hypothetical protein HDU85_002184 [Gaertneriomyces sp. JEL0708]|nr:hypothetical protein HDU85_002184 [Gaertneriomyces sp. JEL0708]
MGVLDAVTAVVVAQTIVFANAVLRDEKLSGRNKVPLLISCLGSIIQRITMMFYMDGSISRSCTLLVVIGNVFGLIMFRYALLFMMIKLYLSIRNSDKIGKTIFALSHCAFLASSILVLYNLITAPIVDHLTCEQLISANVTTANNFLFLISFLTIALPIIWHLYAHIRSVRGTFAQSNSVDAVYFRQLLFMSVFTAVYTAQVLSLRFIREWAWLMLSFIAADYVWLHGILIWVLPQARDCDSIVVPQSLHITSHAGRSTKHLPKDGTGTIAADEKVKSPSTDRKGGELTDQDLVIQAAVRRELQLWSQNQQNAFERVAGEALQP